jgi:sterol desaturase/sphingolipid hydroxylase (fatty acid hydroxylase superfamily)
MRTTKLGYFAEFIVFPVFFVVLTALAFRGDHPRIPVWLSAVLLGALLWPLIEYLLHRFVFHHIPIIAEMHERHHRDPAALIGTPAWVSLSVGIVVALLPLWSVLGFGLAAAATIGVLCGYLWYVLVHYAIHH